MINYQPISTVKQIFDENYFCDPDYIIESRIFFTEHFKLPPTSQQDKDDVKEMQHKLRMLEVCSKNHTSNFKDAAELIGDKIKNSKALMSAFTKFDLSKTGIDGFSAFKYRQVILVDNSIYKKFIPPILQDLENIPKIQYDFLSEKNLSNSSDRIFLKYLYSKNWNEVPQGEYKIQEGAGSSSSIYLTYWLAECVGIAISSPDKSKVAFGHLDRIAIENGSLEKMLGQFPKEIRNQCSVSLVSSYYSKNLENICLKLADEEFKITEADVNPAYFDIDEGNVYMSFPSLNTRYSKVIGMDIEKFFDSKCKHIVAPKAMMIDFSSGKYYLPHKEYLSESSIRFKKNLENFDIISQALGN